MPKTSKTTLKNRFSQQGAVTRRDLLDIVESTFIRDKDGLEHTDNGLEITAKGSSANLLSFYAKNGNSTPWKIQLQGNGLSISNSGESKLYIDNSGNIGVSNTNPQYPLDVSGTVGMKGRIGTYEHGKKPADGKWHGTGITCERDDCMGVEVVAYIFDEVHNRFGLTYVIALYAGGDSGGKITMVTEASNRFWIFGKRQNKIEFQWEDVKGEKELQIRTRSHFAYDNGKPKSVFYRASQIWDKSFEEGIHTARVTPTSSRGSVKPSIKVSGSNKIKINRK